MRLASLYSGGKDSAFSLYIAEQRGHEVPYIVNIVPEDRASWIFHTPNLNCVPRFAEAMGKELVLGRSTGEEDSDMAGLREALDGLDVDGVVSGAVWSDYQWDRMNMVCGDLGLKFIAPMWRKDQDMLLDEIIASGINAVIVGVYAEGFDESWLGRRIDAECARDLKKLRSKYGISIMGEGGEYESMALDAPMFSHGFAIGDCVKDMERNSGTLRVGSLVPLRAQLFMDSGSNIPSLSAFAVTLSDEQAIAAAASMGMWANSPIPSRYGSPAAIGMHIALYTNARNRF